MQHLGRYFMIIFKWSMKKYHIKNWSWATWSHLIRMGAKMHSSQKLILLKIPEPSKHHSLIFSYNPKWKLSPNILCQSQVWPAMCVWERPCIVKGWCVLSLQVHALWFQNSLWGFSVVILRSHSWTEYRGAVCRGKRAGNRAWRSKGGWRRAGRKKSLSKAEGNR